MHFPEGFEDSPFKLGWEAPYQNIKLKLGIFVIFDKENTVIFDKENTAIFDLHIF